MKKIMIIFLFIPVMATAQSKDSATHVTNIIKTKGLPKGVPIPDSLPSISLNDYAEDVNYFIKYLGGLRQDVYEGLTPKQTMTEFWRIVYQKRKK